MGDALTEADIVIASTSAPQPIISREMLAPILRRRRGRPLFLMDIALPRDIEPSVGDLDNVFLYNIDDLQAIVSGQAHERRGEIEKADAIVGDETARFLAWYRAREAVPVIADVQAHLARLADERLTILRARLGSVSEREWQMIETQTRALLDQIALPLITRLKREMREQGSSATSPATYDLLSAARELFGLAQTEAPAPANPSDTQPAPVRDDDSHFAALSVSNAEESNLPQLSVSSFGESKP